MKGILFHVPTGMLAAVKECKKNKTRRLGGLDDVNEEPHKWNLIDEDEEGFHFAAVAERKYALCKPLYKVDEILYIKESHQFLHGKVFYKSDYLNDLNTKEMAWGKWSNSMYCGEYDKKTGLKIARTYIKIKEITCERLNDITPNDCIDEGIQVLQYDEAGILYKDYSSRVLSFKSPIESFESLINTINGRNTWRNNPWVFVYWFELIPPPDEQGHTA